MRRLPVYLLLDTSGSMYGEPIEAVKNGVQTLVSTLRSDPYALETAYLSIITFNSSAQQISPLTELAAFQAPQIDARVKLLLILLLKFLFFFALSNLFLDFLMSSGTKGPPANIFNIYFMF